MGVRQDYSGLIFTKHAQEQMIERGIKQDVAWETWKNPDHVTTGKKIGTEKFVRKFEDRSVTVIAKHNEKHEWIAISIWRDPPLPGTSDARKKEEYKKYQKAGFWGKLLLTAKKQLGF